MVPVSWPPLLTQLPIQAIQQVLLINVAFLSPLPYLLDPHHQQPPNPLSSATLRPIGGCIKLSTHLHNRTTGVGGSGLPGRRVSPVICILVTLATGSLGTGFRTSVNYPGQIKRTLSRSHRDVHVGCPDLESLTRLLWRFAGAGQSIYVVFVWVGRFCHMGFRCAHVYDQWARGKNSLFSCKKSFYICRCLEEGQLISYLQRVRCIVRAAYGYGTGLRTRDGSPRLIHQPWPFVREQ